MSNYLFDNAILDRYAKIANRLPVESELEFADRLLLLSGFPEGTAVGECDSFLDRVGVYRREVAS